MGRTTAWGLAAGGQPGVARAIAILTEEIRRTMQLLGVTRVADLSPEIFA
jgi:isopentenyl diphosphate isomerase/L-lactate dehydrogenase-like FMN-dependent dehydrogenase